MTSSLKDDFYDAVNGEWLKTAQIPADHSSTGGFMDLVDDVDEKLMHDFKAMQDGTLKVDTPELNEFLKFFELASNFKQRDELGFAPVLPYLEMIDNLKDLNDVNQHLKELVFNGVDLPVEVGVAPDLKGDGADKRNVMWADGVDLILPDKTYYAEGNEAGQQLMQVFSNMMETLLQKIGKTAAQAHQLVVKACEFDASLAPFRKNSEELSDIAKLYNPEDFEEFANQVHSIDVKKLVSELIGETPQQIIVSEPDFYKNLDKVVNEDTFEGLKSWMYVNQLRSLTGYLSEEFRQLGGQFGRALSGQKEAMKQTKSAFYLARRTFSQVVGMYYGQKYFGPEAKKDVHQMVEAMIDVYEKRLSNNDWLGDQTKQKAIKKLRSLKILVGYPDELKSVYKKLKTKTAAEGGTLVDNIQAFSKIFIENQLSKYNQPVDRSEWHMSADTVNAYYSPEGNLICFPAAILQAPFYSLKQSASQNYGGIGAVMAHEISHAFDPNGSLFDEYGNMDNWWTDADLQQFKKLSQAVVDQFDGLDFAGGKVNGKLVVTENVADDGGLSAALEAAKNTDNPDLKAFFINWATIWRTKATKEREELLLAIDVHAPSKLRANVQVKNFDEFYEIFNVTENDGMYLAPEKRIQIW